MDLSKLPQMSKTDAPPPMKNAAQGPRPLDYANVAAPRHGAGPEAWLCIAIGLVLLLMQRNLVMWALNRIGLGDPPPPFSNPDTGRFDIPYDQTIFFFLDLGLGLFAVALFLSGIVLLIRNAVLSWIALGLILLSAGWNLIIVVYFYPQGLQIMPAFAVAYGIYVALRQWRVLQERREQATALK